MIPSEASVCYYLVMKYAHFKNRPFALYYKDIGRHTGHAPQLCDQIIRGFVKCGFLVEHSNGTFRFNNPPCTELSWEDEAAIDLKADIFKVKPDWCTEETALRLYRAFARAGGKGLPRFEKILAKCGELFEFGIEEFQISHYALTIAQAGRLRDYRALPTWIKNQWVWEQANATQAGKYKGKAKRRGFPRDVKYFKGSKIRRPYGISTAEIKRLVYGDSGR